MRTHKFNGVKYDIDVDEPFLGICESPDTAKHKCRPHIRIAEDIDTKKGFITLFEEWLHASNYCKDHKIVERVASEGGSLVWRLGYRRPKCKERQH